jgi:hypothetical protein
MSLIRALDRAERIHGAMCSRGWTGKIHALDVPRKSEIQNPNA